MIRHFGKPCVSGLVLCCLAVTAKAAPTFIAGTTPSQRPAGAPVVTEVIKPEGWYALALTGIAPPYPASLRFLEDQGNWFTPFTRPGMLPPYDPRGWHGSE